MTVAAPLLQGVLQRLRQAAAAGVPAPTNAALAAAMGLSVKTIIRAIQQAEAAGRIVVERGICTRIVAAADGSWRTAEPKRPERVAPVRASRTWPSPEADAELRRRHAAGETFSEIAAAMRLRKNQVVGRAHRLGLPLLASPIRQAGAAVAKAARARRKRPPAPASARTVLPVAKARAEDPPQLGGTPLASPVARHPSAQPAPLSIAAVTARLVARAGHVRARACRFPMWPDKERPPLPPRYCDQPTIAGSSYCAAHHALCHLGLWQPGPRRAA